MLNDTVASQLLSPQRLDTTDRRGAARVPFPAEMVIGWHHELPATMRYTVVDVSDTGYRIRSSTPLIEGMTGTALRLLPEGRDITQSVMVAWIRRCDCDDPGSCDECGGESQCGTTPMYEIGLRRF